MVARTLTAGQIAALRLPTVQEMHAVTAAIPSVPDASWSRYNDGPATFLEIGPGVVRLRRTRPGQTDHERELTMRNAQRNVDAAVSQLVRVYGDPMAMLNDGDMAVLGADDPVKRAVRGPDRSTRSTRGKITGWSRRSRNRMQIRLNQLDWTPLFEDGLEPAMVTLTLPGDWETVAPTPAAYKALLERFKVSYARAWSQPVRGVWKQEFQRRGAPHTHMLITPPQGLSHGRHALEFQQWLSHAWANIVNHPDPVQKARHLLAGTGIDYVGEAYRDPRSIAKYFGKHGMFSTKDYQNEMPTLWVKAIDAGEAGTQFWGVWGLKKAVGVLQLADVRDLLADDAGSVDPAAFWDAAKLTYSRIIGNSAGGTNRRVPSPPLISVKRLQDRVP